MDKIEIQSELNKSISELIEWFERSPEGYLEFKSGNSWSAGQHLLHLIKSTKPLAKGLAFPKLLLRLKFGTLKRASISKEELENLYNEKLSNGAKASGPYVPREVLGNEKDDLLKRFNYEKQSLVKVLNKWTEKQLNSQQVKHPILGNISVREILYFTIFHTEHHTKTLKELYEY